MEKSSEIKGVKCIQTVEPYAAIGAVKAATRSLEQEAKKLNEQTLMYAIRQGHHRGN